MNKIRKGDEVIVITGKDKGKRGTVLRMIPDEDRVVVEGVNVVKKNTRSRIPCVVSKAGLSRKPSLSTFPTSPSSMRLPAKRPCWDQGARRRQESPRLQVQWRSG